MIPAIRTSISKIEAEIEHFNKEIAKRMQPFEAQARQLCEIPVINVTSVNELLTEIGVDMEFISTAEHLTSWADLASGNSKSAV